MELDVEDWETKKEMPWTFPITKRAPRSSRTGTKIVVRELHDEILQRLSEPKFKSDLVEKLSKVYSYFLGRVIRISVNGDDVPGAKFEFGRNFSHDRFKSNGVDCTITAGIGATTGDKFLGEDSGWFIFCNFRTVIYADKSALTGWGSVLPQFQPKYRPFLGLVTFTSPNPESLPWTTTKGSINEDNIAWQEARARMVAIARPVIRLLDKRYSDEGTDIQSSRVVELAGKTINIFKATVSSQRTFKADTKSGPKQTKVQYWAKAADLDLIRKHFSSSSMSASEIGRKTFEFFLRNEVGRQ